MKDKEQECKAVIIIGAGRSGTNMLRDILCSIDGIKTWPCDEINYIWRHGNASYPTDEFSPEMANYRVCGFIRKQFEKFARSQKISRVVEKTCANSLRVSFVHKIFPNAKFVHIVRDGRDVSVSAAERWTAKLDIPYLLKKVRFVPVLDIPYYALRYFGNRTHRFLSRSERLAFWGPRFSGMQEVLKKYPLHVACAIQWQKCVERADRDLKEIDTSQVATIRYEDFVMEPENEIESLLSFLNIKDEEIDTCHLVKNVSEKSVGRWRKKMDANIVDQVEGIVSETLSKFGYERSK